MFLTEKKYQEILVEPGHVSADDFGRAWARSIEKQIPLEQGLVELGVIAEGDLARAIADGLGYRAVDLTHLRIPDDILRLLSDHDMRTHRAVLFEVSGQTIKLATSNPWDKTFTDGLAVQFSKEVEVYYATPVGIAATLAYAQSDRQSAFLEIIHSIETHPDDPDAALHFFDRLIIFAKEDHASDIHIEPASDAVHIRFRIDGVLHPVSSYPKSIHERIVARLKILARLRIDEHALPQDGRFTVNGETPVDVRVSLVPITEGENIVLRILDREARRLHLAELGMSAHDLELVQQSVEHTYGMILSVGPTGSGKTTTLYVLMELLNKPEVNVMSIEDPVEYAIAHVQQMQVNTEKGLLFANGLRSIVRQDPDVVMVGEIRDHETADIAINAAMTGHLLLSTMHANDAATMFPRMSEMQIEPFLTASSVVTVIGQRLIRKICTQCKQSYTLSSEEALLLSYDQDTADALLWAAKKDALASVTLYRGAGCAHCGGTGYVDRTGIFEVLTVDEEIRLRVIAKASADEIRAVARSRGMTTMLEDGMRKVVSGETTLSEVMRAIKI